MNENQRFKVLTAERGKDGKTYYSEIGSAWSLKDKDGCSIRLSALPINGELIVVPATRKQEGKS